MTVSHRVFAGQDPAGQSFAGQDTMGPPYEDPAVRRAAAEAIRPGGVVLTDRAIALCALPPGARVLDVGCGTGVTVERLAVRHGLRAVGVDPSARLVTDGRSRRPGLSLLQARAEQLPFSDGSLDAALAECVVSLTDAGAALAELSRVLRPGGLLVVSDLYARATDGAAALRELPPASCLHGAVTRDQLVGLLRTRGFRVRRWEDHSDALARLAVRLLWENGSTTRLWCPGGSDVDRRRQREAVRRSRPGYFLLIAERRGG
jgi:SAM-dependent methyltransferase